jgi:gamma-glutamyltranspeptidase / glutathione hydrolase
MKKLPIVFFVLPFLSSAAAAQTVGVASSADPRVTDAGIEILRQGGTAADAAMAMMVALTVVEPQSSGIGGGGFLLYQDAGKGLLSTINGRETAPAAATQDRFIGPDGKALGFLQAFQGGRSVGVPGNVRLMAETHKRWGSLPWAKLFRPAIRLAEKGFVVNKTLESRLQGIQSLWSNFEGAKSIYWVNGAPVRVGMRLKNPKLAASLKLIARKGPNAFYTGKIAGQIVEAVNSSKLAPGDMTFTDLAHYRAKEQQAVCAPYRVYVVCGMAPPSSGATTVLQILGTLQRFDLAATGKDNPQSWHLIGQAMQLAYADREKYLGDSDFVDVPVKGLLDPEYIQQRSAMIDPDKARKDYPAGNPPGAKDRTAATSNEVAGTTHFTAVDAKGNIANMTSTIEGPFGSQLVAGGFFLNNELTDFTFTPEKNGAPVANRVAAGKRPLSSMSPTIVFDRDGRAVLALGSAGGKRIIMHVAKTLIGVIDFGLPLDRAIALPNIYFDDGHLEVEQGTLLSTMADDLAKYGQPVQPTDLGSKVNGAQWIDNRWAGASDPRSAGTSATIDAEGRITVTSPGPDQTAPVESVG